MTDKNYIPSCFVREHKGPYGSFLVMDCDALQLARFAQNFQNNAGRIRFVITAQKTPNRFRTHSAYLDTFEPKEREVTYDKD